MPMDLQSNIWSNYESKLKFAWEEKNEFWFLHDVGLADYYDYLLRRFDGMEKKGGNQ